MRCFVIQPFDGGRFDKRFDDVFRPAIEDAGLEAYRVDRDPLADIPIESIGEGIRSATVCLADITEDNPNVWYELGFALASGTPVVLICSEERTGRKFPFDIQHRSVIRYSPEAPSDFDELRGKITARIQACLQKGAALRQIAATEKLALVEGLSQVELIVLAVVAGNIPVPGGSASLYSAQQEAEQGGLTKLGFGLGLRRLLAKELLTMSQELDQEADHLYQTLSVTETGWSWLDANEELFATRRDKEASASEDIPF